MLLEFIKELFLSILTNMPGPCGNRLRNLYYRKHTLSIHPTTILDVGVQLINPGSIIIGKNTHIDKYCILIGGALKTHENREVNDIVNSDFKERKGRLVIGNDCHIAPRCILSGIGGLIISNRVTVSADSKIYSLTHHYRSFSTPKDMDFCYGSNAPVNLQCLLRGPILIKDNVGIAANCIILPGVTIEEESFVSIGSVVTRRVLRNQVVAGNPAVFVKNRFEDTFK